MTGAERAIRWSTVAAVAGVALVAGWVSYRHAYAVVRAHGESGTVAWLYPCTIDGLIYAASMVLLDSARRRVRPPALARWLLACGIAATLAANVAAGIAGTAPARAVSMPAVAADGDAAARAALAASIAAGSPLSQREIARRFAMPRSRAAVVAREVITGSNGHG